MSDLVRNHPPVQKIPVSPLISSCNSPPFGLHLELIAFFALKSQNKNCCLGLAPIKLSAASLKLIAARSWSEPQNRQAGASGNSVALLKSLFADELQADRD